jgi:hypothetical protein
MRYREILEACWSGYQQQGMKKKGNRMVPNCVPVSEQDLEEDLRKWFKEKWVRFGPDGKIRGDCARGSSKEGKPKCLPQSKAHSLGKAGRASSAAKKRREDPNPERRGAAKNVATKVKEDIKNLQDYVRDYLATNNLKIQDLDNVDVRRISKEYQLPVGQIKALLIKYSPHIREEQQLDELQFLGSECTKDCSGHRAGYNWSRARGGVDGMSPWSPSFNKGAALAKAGK